MAYTVATVPPHQRRFFEDRRLWARARKEFWKLLRALGAAFFGVECTHPVGDSSPDEFAPHLNFLWCREDAKAPWLPLEQLKNGWRGILERITGLGCGPTPPVVHHQYSTEERKKRHMARYVSRIWPGLNAWLGPQRWQGRYPKKAKRECGCDKCGNLYEFSRPIPMDEYRRKLCKALTRTVEIDGERMRIDGSDFLIDAGNRLWEIFTDE